MTGLPGAGDPVLVCGAGVAGTAAAEALLRRGALVTVVDGRDDESMRARAAALRALGATVRLGPEADAVTPAAYDLAVVSPGWRPDHPLPVALATARVPVWGDAELAWRLGRRETGWLVVTGTNGKTTTTELLAAMLAAAGLRAGAAGNIGTALVEAVLRDPPPELLAVELSSFQLHWSRSIRPRAAAVLNVAPDHLDWHGSMSAYARAKGRAFALGPGGTAVYNVADPWATRLADAAAVDRRVGFALDPPEPGRLGVQDGVLIDAAFGAGRLVRVDELRLEGRHNVENALAAAALALAADVDAEAIREALRSFTAGPHRLATVAVVDGVRYVDDSKATNPHAAARALAAYDRVVWIAGGLNKGLGFDDLVAAGAARIVAAVLIGSCADELRDALARHAPEVPVHDAGDLHTAVKVARGLAAPGDTVLLAPAAASMDMFRDYAERGDVFAAAVHALEGRR